MGAENEGGERGKGARHRQATNLHSSKSSFACYISENEFEFRFESVSGISAMDLEQNGTAKPTENTECDTTI